MSEPSLSHIKELGDYITKLCSGNTNSFITKHALTLLEGAYASLSAELEESGKEGPTFEIPSDEIDLSDLAENHRRPVKLPKMVRSSSRDLIAAACAGMLPVDSKPETGAPGSPNTSPDHLNTEQQPLRQLREPIRRPIYKVRSSPSSPETSPEHHLNASLTYPLLMESSASDKPGISLSPSMASLSPRSRYLQPLPEKVSPHFRRRSADYATSAPT